jgi:Uma2 family endonuclease
MATANPKETATPGARGLVGLDPTQSPCKDGAGAPGIVLPDHTQLPCEDGTIVTNFDEHPQSILLTDSILPALRRRHPDGQFAIGQDSGIYWRFTDPPLRGCVAPDWFYVPDVPPDLDGRLRRSYVLWKELISPLIALEFSSGDGSEERDRTPWSGKFWIYEKAVHVWFYAIFGVESGILAVYHLVDGSYQPLAANERGHFPIAPLGVELGVWRGYYLNRETSWMRWWDHQGNLLLTGAEREEEQRHRADEEHRRADEAQQQADEEHRRADEAQQQADEEHRRANEAQQRADAERHRAESLAARLRALGVDPDDI